MPAFRTFVPAVCLAVALAASPILGASALGADEVVVKAGDTLSGISKRHGVALSTLVAINAIEDPNRIFVGQRLQLSSPTAPPAPPPVAPPPPAAAQALVHTVARGDNLWSIARYYGVSLSELVSVNGIGNATRIHPGQQLTIPGAAPVMAPPAPAPAPPAAPAPVAPPPPADAPAQALVHTVARGDNLWSIARYYGVSLSELVSGNGIGNASRIHPGQQLILPGAAPVMAPPAPAPAPPAAPAPVAPPPPTAAQALVHTVARGDNLWSIARFYGVSLSELVSANGIGNASRIHPGQQLTIPGAAPVVAPAPVPAPVPAPGSPAMSAWMAQVVAARDGMRQVITEEATAAGVPVPLALAVAWQESGWRQGVVSSAGAVGVMQLMPGTAQWVGQTMLGRAVNINDARDNVHAGVRLLAHYLSRYGGNRDLVLAAYYQGQGAADRHGVYPVSLAYIASVDALVHLFGG